MLFGEIVLEVLSAVIINRGLNARWSAVALTKSDALQFIVDLSTLWSYCYMLICF